MTQRSKIKPLSPVEEDLPGIITLVDSVMREGSKQSMLTDYPLVFRKENRENMHVIKTGGRIVAEVPFIPRIIKLGQSQFSIGIISATSTHPDHRKKGYALACLNENIELMEKNGIELSVLWTIVPTFYFYNHSQFQAIRKQMVMYLCEKRDAFYFTHHGHEIVRYNPDKQDYLDAIKSMHNEEPNGACRDTDTYKGYFSLPNMTTWIALDKGQPIAYLIASLATNKPGIIEGGGDEIAIETLIQHALSEWPEFDEPIRSYGYLLPSRLGKVMESKLPDRHEPWSGNMMIRLNLPRNFFESIKLWLEKKNNGRKRAFSIEISDMDEIISFDFTKDGLKIGQRKNTDHLTLTRRQLTSAVFGYHQEVPIMGNNLLSDIFPFYFPLWILDHS